VNCAAATARGLIHGEAGRRLAHRSAICKTHAATLTGIGSLLAAHLAKTVLPANKDAMENVGKVLFQVRCAEDIMLYDFYELSRSLLKPVAQLSQCYAGLLADPFFPLSQMPFAKGAAAGYELVHRLGKSYDKPAFDIRSVQVDGRHVPVVAEIVRETPFCTLLHFKKAWGGAAWTRPAQAAVLLVAPLSGHHATLLRDTLGELLKDHDVYLTDWADARLVPASAGPFGLSDYICHVQDFIRLLDPELHIVSVCQSAPPVLAAISLMASAKESRLPRSMTMIGGPIDTRNSPTAVNRLAMEKPLSWFENMMIHPVPYGYPGHGRRVCPGFLQLACFVSMNAGRHAESYGEFYRRRSRGDPAERHCAFYDEYNATLDMPEEFYLETIQAVFQECWLARGIWKVGGRMVRPQDIKTVALLTIEGERDDITGAGQTAAAHDLCAGIPPSKRKHFVAPDCGHYCIFSGHLWRQMIYPQIRSFIQANAGTTCAAEVPAAGGASLARAACPALTESA
jgi:poly(3-hydroxybutyrate) depolymerase